MKEQLFKCTVTSTYMIEAKDYYEAREIIYGYIDARNIRHDSVKIEEMDDSE